MCFYKDMHQEVKQIEYWLTVYFSVIVLLSPPTVKSLYSVGIKCRGLMITDIIMDTYNRGF